MAAEFASHFLMAGVFDPRRPYACAWLFRRRAARSHPRLIDRSGFQPAGPQVPIDARAWSTSLASGYVEWQS
jgi:hypothetical protein